MQTFLALYFRDKQTGTQITRNRKHVARGGTTYIHTKTNETSMVRRLLRKRRRPRRLMRQVTTDRRILVCVLPFWRRTRRDCHVQGGFQRIFWQIRGGFIPR
jgi:hypothetical protein